ncbi:orotidine-5'-phosphate decarboxylase [Caldanaerobius fijiensis DSM 17918]|uniref:Orotidine 5'-phosphate decarboxylase n=1 Tax=Caldanaerobius fijiensis DSM 17918 TaxID=1121256 RepID=A0A1M4TSZ9_9THEO|nr:orotidine-5'-phosphate decarboxylase [Caldanaerobius fijiensis]SHE47538.1 orotidine-5'-phosphate decarboxylase [Caldanaerobius fijiensis DSM 17918]
MLIDKFISEIESKRNCAVVGLDTQYEYVPDKMKKSDPIESIWEFNKRIIDAIYEIVAVVKIQIAMYEQYGVAGLDLFYRTSHYAKEKGMYVIADVKRGDISSTAVAYSKAFLTRPDIDFVTVNPYMGYDSIKPFIDDCVKYDKGIFILTKTSNPSSGDIQDLIADGRPIYEHVAIKVDQWGKDYVGERGYSFVGAVIGATYPEQAKKLRALMPNAYILVPGYGVQGATAQDAAAAFNRDGLGAIVNSSRGILLSYKKHPEIGLEDAIIQEVIRMRDDLNSAIRGDKK